MAKQVTKLVHNERMKLVANAANNIGIAALAAGAIIPGLRLGLQDASTYQIMFGAAITFYYCERIALHFLGKLIE
jgi:hypothetical protein